MTNSSVMFKDILNQTYSLPKISALVFRFFFFSTSVSGNTLFSSSSGAWQRSLMTSGRSRMPFSHGSMGGRGVPGFTARWCRHWKTARVEKQIQDETEQTRVDLHSSGTWELSYATIIPVTQQNTRQGWHNTYWAPVPGKVSGIQGWGCGGPWKCPLAFHHHLPPPASWSQWDYPRQTTEHLEKSRGCKQTYSDELTGNAVSTSQFLELRLETLNMICKNMVPVGVIFLLFSREGNENCLRSSMKGSWIYIRHCWTWERHICTVQSGTFFWILQFEQKCKIRPHSAV